MPHKEWRSNQTFPPTACTTKQAPHSCVHRICSPTAPGVVSTGEGPSNLFRVSSGLHKNRNLSDRKVKIPIERGVRQGDTISPRLFTAALRYAISELDWEGKGYSIDTKKISNLRFVDDIALIANSTAEMETTVNELNVVGLKIGLEMNMSKTQPMVNQWCDAVEVNLAGKALQQVDS
ncbi:hypothetical protein Y032_0319g2366 [Ancylostoma ceylanicum]|uniref:Reverse transcriptase domain-containing protein n=1 Tax=Ancylostoma ceylanicum TaxID=53326 RepID=A0A016S1U0_9BILA|nr:hypothetical protein Y032_0319g2366 [Ancylostoma ceylanicum]